MYDIYALATLVISLILIAGVLFKKNTVGNGESKLSSFWEFISNFLDKYYWVVLILIGLAFLVTRLFRFDSYPNGIHIDEISMATDAKMLRDWGTDRLGVRYPVYLQSYGGGQNVFSTYANMLLFKFVPITISSMRILSVVWGLLCLIATFGICSEILEDRKWGLIGAILVTILPVYLMSERWALESYVLLPLSTIAMYFAIKAVKSNKLIYFILTGIMLGAAMYTYAISYFVFPIMLVLVLAYLLYLERLTVKNALGLIIPLAILGAPLIAFQLVVMDIIPSFSTPFSDFFAFPFERETEISLANIPNSLIFMFKGMLVGGEELSYNSTAEFGNVYLFLVPLVVLGLGFAIWELVRSLKEREFKPSVLVLIFFVASFIVSILLLGPNTNRVNEIYMPICIFICMALFYLFRNKKGALVTYGVMGAATFVFFLYFYFCCFDEVYGMPVLFTSDQGIKAVFRAEENYVQDGTEVYITFEDHVEKQNMKTYFFFGDEDEKWSEECMSYGNVTIGFPEEFDENENAIYILDYNGRDHIISYLTSLGWYVDNTYPEYAIVVKPQLLGGTE